MKESLFYRLRSNPDMMGGLLQYMDRAFGRFWRSRDARPDFARDGNVHTSKHLYQYLHNNATSNLHN